LDRVLEAEGDSTNRYKVSKQPDVLMLLYLLAQDELRGLLAGLGYEVSEEQLVRTVDYYFARTSHGSTLSAVVIAWILTRYAPHKAWRFLQQALQSDLADVQGDTTAEGIHLGAMAGTVDLVMRCMTGMRALGQVLRFDPAMPPEIKQLRFSVHYRGHRIDLVFFDDSVEVSSRPSPAAPITVLVREQTVELHPGARHTFSMASGREAHR
jgi:trehalose/maltose hydrolase-like predicted phosphorylase